MNFSAFPYRLTGLVTITTRHHIGIMRFGVQKLMAAGLCAVFLAGCGGEVGEVLGFERDPSGPDEFAVVKRAPLTLPPDFGLRPPSDGQEDLNVVSPRSTARRAVLGEELTPRQQQRVAQARIEQGQAPSEVALLTQASALNTDPEIRKIVDEESDAIARESDTFVNDLIFWREPPEPGAVVDADEEARRLQENASLGRPVTDGVTPTISTEDDGIQFNWPFD